MSKKKAQHVRPLARLRCRRLANGLDVRVHGGPQLGPGMTVASMDAVFAALERFDPALPWKTARHQILPMLPRVRPFPGPDDEAVRVILPPGILVSFGIDLGPAITFVGSSVVAHWRVDRSSLAEAALRNLRARADECGPGLVIRDHIAATPVMVLQSRLGIAASLLLVPEHLDRLFGPGPHLMLAPMRDLLIALPADVDRSFAAWLAEEWEALDPNHLHLGGFVHQAGVVVPEPLEGSLAEA
jgi:hypothetical protein